MPSRRNHSKSRHGCAQCKAAHVKCDQSHPVCGKCTKTKKHCEFTALLHLRPSSTLTTPSNQNVPAISLSDQANSSQKDTTLCHVSGIPLSAISWDDLELLHHYSTVTYATLASRKDLLEMWKFNVPKMALKQRYLMHSLFSVTALHMASTRSENQTSYVDMAIRHHNIALKEYSSSLDNINQDKGPALFICATLIVIFALSLAVIRPQKEITGPVDEISSVFMLLRGVPVVLSEMWPWVEQSEISPLFSGRELHSQITLSNDIIDALQLLGDRNMETCDTDCSRESYALAIEGLRDCFKRLSSKDSDSEMILSWPITMSPTYIASLAARRPMALAILAHFAVILHDIRNKWWAREWGKQLVNDIYRMVDEEWRPLTAWPMAKVGVVNII